MFRSKTAWGRLGYSVTDKSQYLLREWNEDKYRVYHALHVEMTPEAFAALCQDAGMDYLDMSIFPDDWLTLYKGLIEQGKKGKAYLLEPALFHATEEQYEEDREKEQGKNKEMEGHYKITFEEKEMNNDQ